MLKPDPGGDSPLSRACKVIAELRKTRPAYLALEIIREGDPQRQPVFFRHLVEDHASFPGGQYSYQEFMAHVSRHACGGVASLPPSPLPQWMIRSS